MIHHIWTKVAENDLDLITINDYRKTELDPITVEVPELPFPEFRIARR